MTPRGKLHKTKRLENLLRPDNIPMINEQINITTGGRTQLAWDAQKTPAHACLLKSLKHSFQDRMQHQQKVSRFIRQSHTTPLSFTGSIGRPDDLGISIGSTEWRVRARRTAPRTLPASASEEHTLPSRY